MQNLKSLSFLISILVVHQLWTSFIQNSLHPIHFSVHNLFILELIDKGVDDLSGINSVLDVANIIIFWLISRRIFANHFSLIPVVIYAISPWSSYLVVAKSFYIFLLFLLLLIFYGFLLIDSKKVIWGTILITGATTLSLYSSFFMFFVIPLLFCGLLALKLIPFNKIKISLCLIFILSLPLLIQIYKNHLAFQNILRSEIAIFSDPGLLNMANSYQGAARQANLGVFARISENKYIFSSELLILKFIKHLAPSTYFTSQEKLLNFSFTPPIYLGFFLPFVFGVYQVFKFPYLRKWFILSLVLIIPSILSKSMVDLNRLFILMPVVVLLITFGMITLFKQKKQISKIVLGIIVFMIIFQAFVTISDIQIREKVRFIRYFGNNFEIGIQ